MNAICIRCQRPCISPPRSLPASRTPCFWTFPRGWLQGISGTKVGAEPVTSPSTPISPVSSSSSGNSSFVFQLLRPMTWSHPDSSLPPTPHMPSISRHYLFSGSAQNLPTPGWRRSPGPLRCLLLGVPAAASLCIPSQAGGKGAL